MALPLIPLLVGTGAGAGVTYLTMSKTAREMINKSATQVTDTVKKGVKATQTKLSSKKDTPPTAAETVSETATPTTEPKS
ncbi:MAG: hypothetical protein ABFS56_20800 [Pseudomonadota bacterium]